MTDVGTPTSPSAAQERDEIVDSSASPISSKNELPRKSRRIERILAQTRARGYGTRDPAFVGGLYRTPTDDGLAGIAVPLLTAPVCTARSTSFGSGQR